MEYAGDFFMRNAEETMTAYKSDMPLAARMRPNKLSDFVGQEHLLGKDKELLHIIRADCFSSLLFSGPPGTGKTTLAHLIAHHTQRRFVAVSAVTSNSQDIRRIIEDAHRLKAMGSKTILFVDEIHRFNKAQQDLLLPHIENGTISFIGVTTHNPYFSCIAPLVSRSQAFRLKALDTDEVMSILQKALNDVERGFGSYELDMEEGFLKVLADLSDGDARRALNILELIVLSRPEESSISRLRKKDLHTLLQDKPLVYDKDEDEHYDTISAFIKSVRASEADAALYWLAKMIHAGEDILFIARRLIILASEDIGNADPQALTIAVSCLNAIEFIGLPEARIILSQTTIYLCCAPKSNASYTAIERALTEVKSSKTQSVPGYLKNIKAPDEKDQKYFSPHQHPDKLLRYMPVYKKFLMLTESGNEAQMKRRLEQWGRERQKKKEDISRL